MNKVNPASVQIEWSGANATRQAFRNRYTLDDRMEKLALKAISESIDGINSKELIDKLSKNTDINDCDIIGITILEEIQRLFVRCFDGAEMIAWSFDTPTGSTMRTLEKCIKKIVKYRSSVTDDIVYLIRYKIKYLFDVNNLGQFSNEAFRLIGFIEYFIKVFTDSKRVIG